MNPRGREAGIDAVASILALGRSRLQPSLLLIGTDYARLKLGTAQLSIGTRFSLNFAKHGNGVDDTAQSI